MTTRRASLAETKSRRTPTRDLGRKVTRNISVQLGVIEEVDRIAAVAKTKTGLQMDRSKLLGVLSELLLEAERHLALDHIYTPQNFKAAVAKAIRAHAQSINGTGHQRKGAGHK